MKLRTIILKNFRAYRKEARISVNDLTAFIGKNDIGKSTILEALEIFFNSENIKITKEDLSKGVDDQTITIGCEFDEYPETIVLDSSAETNLSDEYLLNESGRLEILKKFSVGASKIGAPGIYARAKHPATEKANDLLSLKNQDLKKRVDEIGVDGKSVNKASNPSMRQGIWNTIGNLNQSVKEISLNEPGAKEIWTQVENALPIYALFKADRPSTDEDAEIQDPMKLAVAEVIKEVESELEGIKKAVETKVTEVAERTLVKLQGIDPALSRQLKPNFRTEPKWDSIFKMSLTADDEIPINKRGSGVRRLILISFFRAEAERKQAGKDAPGIIYAIEEPETSQHPNNQKLLAEAFLELSDNTSSQVLLTTHVPGFAELLPVESLRYVGRNESGDNIIDEGDEKIAKFIADELGVFPDHRVRCFLCVEGKNDVSFFKAISVVLRSKNPSLPDLSQDPRVIVLPLGGTTLRSWVQQDYLREFNRPEIHVYDRGDDSPPEYEEQCGKINSRTNGSWATVTGKREVENYLHPDLINQEFGITISFGNDDDVPLLVAKGYYEVRHPDQSWDHLGQNKQKKLEDAVKKRLNRDVVARMTPELLEAQDPSGEIEHIVTKVAHLIDG